MDDPYSHLAAQLLDRLVECYDVELVTHLVGPPSDANAPERALLAAYARKDAADVAPHYGLTFPRDAAVPTPDQVARISSALAGAKDPTTFAARATALGDALWSGAKDRLAGLAADASPADEAETARRIAAGTERRRKLGHYAGAMFYYGGEWYWGIDRLYHLEQRLAELGATRPEARVPIAPCPAIDPEPPKVGEDVALEFFPSLRSPYTAAAYEPTLALAQATGARLVLRPVLPMVMRGAPVTLVKGSYIFFDTKREAEARGIRYGRSFVDPVGPPVERAYSLFPWARERGRGAELLGAFLRAAFDEGVDTSREAGLRHVVEAAGLPWSEASAILGNEDWCAELEANRQAMYRELGLWGVPSYRVRGPEGVADFSTWGQDRLWLVAAELRARAAQR